MAGAGPYIPSVESRGLNLPVSPIELLYWLLKRDLDASIAPGGVRVGPAENEAQQSGCVSLTVGGNAAGPDRYAPVQSARVQIRCLAHQMASVDLIAQHVYQLLHVRHREVVLQESTGNSFLVHRTAVLAGPSTHYDGSATWEALMFIEVMVGTDPLP